MATHRMTTRRRVLKAATAVFNEKWYPLDCQVRNISDTGCRLRTEDAHAFPHTFKLCIDLDGLEADCRVVWRAETDLGVCFVDAPRSVTPKRSQTIEFVHSALERRGWARRTVRARFHSTTQS